VKYQLTYSDRFINHYKKLNSIEQKQIKEKIILLSQNPMHPSLRSKKIQGIDDLFECSVTMDIRIIWNYEEDRIITLVDVGRHDILK
jgi:mRNA interferase RelE/StbE